MAENESTTEESEKPKFYLDDPANRSRLFRILLAVCGVSFLLDFGFLIFDSMDKHEHVRWENWPGFYGIFGFVACLLVVLVTKYFLRPIVQRKEDFYDD